MSSVSNSLSSIHTNSLLLYPINIIAIAEICNNGLAHTSHHTKNIIPPPILIEFQHQTTFENSDPFVRLKLTYKSRWVSCSGLLIYQVGLNQLTWNCLIVNWDEFQVGHRLLNGYGFEWYTLVFDGVRSFGFEQVKNLDWGDVGKGWNGSGSLGLGDGLGQVRVVGVSKGEKIWVGSINTGRKSEIDSWVK